ncbi:glutathione S-transferase family protein [Qipengyuania flava]|uniref:glutathione S-transferase family protein n=1 Tax=Qipengyuania flava TaxID=192812 RepID=UPI001C632FE4|nr:glutathione S-transferase family protein [Qipengyuania flava]QYJ06618.1 glutathione S-transferase family protein [Qipengyuania flava]
MSAIKAYHLPGRWGLVTVSPFCLKLDAFFRMTGIEHQSITAATPFAGPKKKAPWIEYQGRTLGDSALIIDFLKGEFGVDPDARLSAAQKGAAVAIQRMIEENLYWAMVYDRWRRDENWPILKGSVLGDIPAPVRAILAPYARRAVTKQLEGHGMGLHSPEEIEAISAKDIGALAGLLGDQDWFFGEQPTMTDATVYSLLANIAYVPFSSPMKPMIAGHANLAAWLDRFRARFYPEFTPQ